MILVTGGTGLVGIYLLFYLLSKDLSVRAIHRRDSNLNAVKKVFSYYYHDPDGLFDKIDWVEADITDIPALEIAFENITQVYHCAALISFDPKDFKRLQRANEKGTANIANLCIAKQVKKLCFVSSIGAIGKSPDRSLATEENEWNDNRANVYGLTKHLAEMEIWRASQEGVPVVILNPGVILGPGFWYGGSGSIFRIVAKGPAFYPPGGTGFVTVNDVVKIMAELMDSDIANERFIVIDKNLSYKEILSNIAREFGKSTPKRALKFWQLNLLWRLDWLRSLLTGKKRKLTKKEVESLRRPEVYSNRKILGMLNFEFELMAESVYFTCNRFKESYPAQFS
ncbi:MAG TPA: NAD-dependent epimerase/dehydratase family protein [Eudoraea sp.]|nr:NAD-dependent epimerase/dehydratase family protein [Eudoraea sp.]